MALTQRLLPQPGNAHQEQPLGHDFARRGCRASRNSLRRSSSHFFRPSRPPTSPSSVPSAMNSITPLRLTSSRFSSSSAGSDSRPERAARGQRAAQRVARFVEREPLQRAAPAGGSSARLRQSCRARSPRAGTPTSSTRSGGRSSRNMQAALDFLRNEAHRRRDDDELPLVEAALVDVAQAAPDLGGFAQRLVKILQVEDGRGRGGRR